MVAMNLLYLVYYYCLLKEKRKFPGDACKRYKKSIWVIIFLPANFEEMVTCAERFPQEMIWLPQENFFGVETYAITILAPKTSNLPKRHPPK